MLVRVRMNEKATTKRSSVKLSPDVQALVEAADTRSATERAVRRSAARSRAEAARKRKDEQRRARDGWTLGALVFLIALCWTAAGLALFFF